MARRGDGGDVPPPVPTANVLKSFRRMASLLLYRQNRGGAARKTCAGDSAEWANHIMNTCGGGGDGIIDQSHCDETTIGEGCGDPAADRARRRGLTVMPDAYHRSTPCHTLFLPVIT